MGDTGKVRTVREQCEDDAGSGGRNKKRQEWKLEVLAQSFSWELQVGERNTQF